MSFTIAQDENVASLSVVKLAQAYNITSLLPLVQFVEGAGWDTIDFLEEYAQLTDETAESDNGLQYTYNLIFSFNKKRSDLLASLAPYLGTGAIALVTDNNGLTQIIGNLQSPITFKQNNDSGLKFGDMNNVAITGAVITDTAAIIPVPVYQAVDDAISVDEEQETITIPILANDLSSEGIDPASVEIVLKDVGNPIAPTWDPDTELLTYTLRAMDGGNVRTLQYQWTDLAGNQSNVANVNITITPSIVNAVDDAVSVDQGQASVLIPILTNDEATNGINPATVEIVTQDEGAPEPATFDRGTQEITYYLRANDGGNTRTLQYQWADNGGKESNVATVTINITGSARATAWRGLASSAYCVQNDDDQNTGYLAYATLEQYYTDDNSATGVTKANINTDPNYIAPVYNTETCPLPVIVQEKELGYNESRSEVACSFADPANYYYAGAAGSSPQLGTVIYNQVGLTTKAVPGYYSDRGSWYQVNGAGTVIATGAC
jgi:hypothetical protein